MAFLNSKINDEKNPKLNTSKMKELLDWSYEKALNGIPGTPTAQEMAEDHLSKHGTVEKAIESLINWQCAKGASSGFLTGLGGIITMPVAIPVNVASVTYVQMRMVAAIAHMRGYDLKSEQVKTLVFLALTGQGAVEILKDFGIKNGTQLLKAGILKIPNAVIKQIQKKVTLKLVAIFGAKGVVNLGKLVPVVGGVIGAVFDGVRTRGIGNVAKDTLFLKR